jgi:hypothetical protein
MNTHTRYPTPDGDREMTTAQMMALFTKELSAPPVRCFACNKSMKGSRYLAACQDDQTVFVGPECFREIRKSGSDGYQPELGGPRLYLVQFTKHGARP